MIDFSNFDIIHCCVIQNMYNIVILCGLQNLNALSVELLASKIFNEQKLYSAFDSF